MPRLAHDAVLSKGHNLNVNDAAELLANANERLDRLKARLAVNIGEGANVQIAVESRHRHGAAGIRRDPGFGVFLLDLAGELDAGHGALHAVGLIGLERFLFHHRQGPHLAQMQMRIDVRFGDKIAGSVDLDRCRSIKPFANGGDAAVADADRRQGITTATEPRAPDRDVECVGHSWCCQT